MLPHGTDKAPQEKTAGEKRRGRTRGRRRERGGKEEKGEEGEGEGKRKKGRTKGKGEQYSTHAQLVSLGYTYPLQPDLHAYLCLYNTNRSAYMWGRGAPPTHTWLYWATFSSKSCNSCPSKTLVAYGNGRNLR